jgi:hypothetical protein
MTRQRTIIYGDIHGCLEEFKRLREELNITPTDREILVGDLLDRGPHSNAVVTYARENSLELVMGNHEYKYLRYKKHDKAFHETGKKNPMSFNDEKQSIYENLSEDDFEYLDAAPFFIKIDNTTVLHAGITNNIDLSHATKKELESLTRIRLLDENQKTLALGQNPYGSAFWSEWYDGNQGVIVYGHEAFNNVKIDKFSFGIDTGCVYGDKLTALVIFDTKEPMFNYDIIQVRAKLCYSLKK